MSATLPLPLELAQTTKLAADMNTLMKEMLGANDTKYNPETQVREDQEGRAVFIYGGGTRSHSGSKCWQGGLINVDDVTIDDVLG
ncbi:MAG: hypothetical protein ACJ8CB_18270 [Ktedonobacteraceae bacterium]